MFDKIKNVDGLLSKLVPKDGDSGLRRRWKAATSFWYEGEIKEANAAIWRRIELLTWQGVAHARNKDLSRESP